MQQPLLGETLAANRADDEWFLRFLGMTGFLVLPNAVRAADLLAAVEVGSQYTAPAEPLAADLAVVLVCARVHALLMLLQALLVGQTLATPRARKLLSFCSPLKITRRVVVGGGKVCRHFVCTVTFIVLIATLLKTNPAWNGKDRRR